LSEIRQERLLPREKRRNQRGVKRKMSNYPLRKQPSQDIGVMLQQGIDLSHDFLGRLEQHPDMQRMGDLQRAGLAAAQAHLHARVRGARVSITSSSSNRSRRLRSLSGVAGSFHTLGKSLASDKIF
jgi:hypothetical protein